MREERKCERNLQQDFYGESHHGEKGAGNGYVPEGEERFFEEARLGRLFFCGLTAYVHLSLIHI